MTTQKRQKSNAKKERKERQVLKWKSHAEGLQVIVCIWVEKATSEK